MENICYVVDLQAVGAVVGMVAAVIGLVVAVVWNAVNKTAPDKTEVSSEQLPQEMPQQVDRGLNWLGPAVDLIYDD